jgi:putative oxidoreductase
MKIINTLPRILFGLLTAYGGVMHFTVDVHIWKNDFLNAIFDTHYLWQTIGIFNLIFGTLLLFNRYVLLSILVLLPITFNIFIYHAYYQMDGGLFIGIPMFGLNLWLIWQYHTHFKSLLTFSIPNE